MTEYNAYSDSQAYEDVRFLLSFVPEHLKDKSKIEEGMLPMFYTTLSYEGDLKLAEQVEKIRQRADTPYWFEPGY